MSERYRSRVVSEQFRPWETIIVSTEGGDCTKDPSFNFQDVNSGDTIAERHFESMTDVETPDFHKLKRQGKIINSPMSKLQVIESISPNQWRNNQTHEVKKTCDGVSQWVTSGVTTQEGSVDVAQKIADKGGTVYLPLEESESNMDSMKNRAISQAWGSINHSEVMSLVTLAELDKTVGGLADLLKKVLRITTAVKRKDIKYLRNSWGGLKRDVSFSDLSDIYLNARYGLRPLFYEARGILKALQTSLDIPTNRFTFRGSDSSTITDSSDDEIKLGGYYLLNWWVKFHKSARLETTVRAGVLTELDELTANKLAGVDLIAESALELVPYSFIAGWFFNLADYVSSWAPNVGSKTLASWVSIEQTLTQSTVAGASRFAEFPSSSLRVVDYDKYVDCRFDKTTISYTRIPEPSRPLLPQFVVNLDVLKLLDIGLIAKGLRQNALPSKARF